MATEIDLTNGVIRMPTNATYTYQQIQQSVDVSRYDQVDLLLHVAGVEGAVTTFIVSIMSGMQLETDDGWVALAPFASVTTANGTAVLNVPKLFKYIRWKVTTITGGTAVSFTIRGMARNN